MNKIKQYKGITVKYYDIIPQEMQETMSSIDKYDNHTHLITEFMKHIGKDELDRLDELLEMYEGTLDTYETNTHIITGQRFKNFMLKYKEEVLGWIEDEVYDIFQLDEYEIIDIMDELDKESQKEHEEYVRMVKSEGRLN